MKQVEEQNICEVERAIRVGGSGQAGNLLVSLMGVNIGDKFSVKFVYVCLYNKQGCYIVQVSIDAVMIGLEYYQYFVLLNLELFFIRSREMLNRGEGLGD